VWREEVAMGQDEQAIGFEDGGKKDAGVEGGSSAGPGPSESGPHADEAEKRVNPSAPGETGTTPGTNAK
jgi:hypothetical protein